jgi:putative tryptophan/tyrosine transport system substrate-binding protein
MFDRKRREFITLLGGAAAAPMLAPHRADAQQRDKPVVGLLNMASHEMVTHLTPAFRQGLNDSGFIEGQDVTIEYRYADSRPDRLPELLADLLQRKAAVIVTPGSSAAAVAAKAATSTIPILFSTGDDPTKLGLVASLNRPGGNATGVNFFSIGLGQRRWDCCASFSPRPRA